MEIRRLLNVMPASSRMTVKITSKPRQTKVIDAAFPLPWHRERPISINFDLWFRITEAQRDLLLLQKANWLSSVKWFQPNIYHGVVAAGVVAGFVESAEADAVGVAVAVGLSAMALLRIWRGNQAPDSELNADMAAIKVAQRRGYSEIEAAQHLLSAIESVSQLEGYGAGNFNDLMRCQNLQAIANSIPNSGGDISETERML